MPLARVNIPAITAYILAHDNAHGCAARWQERCAVIKEALGADRLVWVTYADDGARLDSLDLEWSVRAAPPGSYRVLSFPIAKAALAAHFNH